ncbi:MAG: hypothetical protein HGA72_06180 [Chlorobiaceae bacterium]|nr:hypothetical protein [Chlorobiaceae bacterium]
MNFYCLSGIAFFLVTAMECSGFLFFAPQCHLLWSLRQPDKEAVIDEFQGLAFSLAIKEPPSRVLFLS